MHLEKSGRKDNSTTVYNGGQYEKFYFLFFYSAIRPVYNDGLWRSSTNESDVLLYNRFGL